jgi:GEVED domain
MKSIRSRLALVCVLGLLLGAAHAALGVGVRPTTTRPPNDDCANAKAVGNVANLAFDTTHATFDGPGHYLVSPNVWYCYTAPCTGCATVSLAGSSFDTKLAIYDGCGCYPGADKLIKGNDDASGQQSEASFPVTSGHQYLIEVGGFNASVVGQGVISISCDSQAILPDNDDCSHAEPITSGTYRRPFDTTCATFDGPALCINSPNLWYSFTATQTENIIVSLLGSQFDTKLAVYKGDTCYPKSDDLIECNDDWPGWLQSKIILQATAGQKYLIEVGGYNADAVGQGVLSVAPEGGATPPPASKDDCASAQSVGNVTNLAFDTTQATFDGPGYCITSPNVWFLYTATATGDVTVSLLGSAYDTQLAVYQGATCYPKQSDMLGCNDDFGDSRQSQLTFAATSGSQYLIEVGGYGSSTGQGVLTITAAQAPPPTGNANDCSDAVPIGEVTDLPFDTTGANFDGRAYCMVSPNIWYCYTASCTGDVTITLSEVSFDTMLAVYNGCSCYPEDLIECNDDYGGGYASQITFAAVSGNQYLIEVGGYNLETGHGLLTVSCAGAVPADKTDLGDAPDSTNNAGKNMTAYPAGGPLGVKANYPTVYMSGDGTGPYGPLHVNHRLVAYLGKKITRETEADSGTDEDGVNNIDPSSDKPNQDGGDDGVIFPISMPQCRWTTFDYLVNVVDPNVDMYVNVWCDWNRDGDWDDTVQCTSGPVPEWAVQNQLLFNLPVGLNTIRTPAFLCWNPETGPEEMWMRITLSEQPWKGGSNPGVKGNGGSGPQSKYQYGETEDYYFAPDVTVNICEDFNGDGVINTEDLVAFTSAWLANCPQ